MSEEQNKHVFRRLKVIPQDSSGLLILENTFHARGGPARHLHYDQDEWFYAVEGEFLIKVGQERMRLRPGDSLLAPRKSLEDAPEQRAFWEAYSEEMIRQLTKADLIVRYRIAVDFDATSRFTPDDLKNWAGRILILEGDNDPIAEAPARGALKTFHPQARVHTFHGTGHVASIAKLDEYVSVIKQFLHED